MCKNYNSSNRSLVTTLVVLAICLVIVTGSTFSLFTSNTGVNIAVTAGNVEFEATIKNALILYSMDKLQEGTFENGGTAVLNDDKNGLTITNITPGDKVELTIDLANKSNVKTAYRVLWSYGENDSLTKLEVSIKNADDSYTKVTTGTSQWYYLDANAPAASTTLVIELPATAGNDQMKKVANISFAVEAVQANGTTQYDPTAYVNTVEGIQEAIDAGATEIVLNEDITLTEPLILGGATYSLRSVPQVITFDLNGNKIVGAISKDTGALVINNGNFKIVNSIIENTAVNGGATIENYGTLVLENATVIGAPIADGGYPEYCIVNSGNLTVNAGTEVSSDRGCISIIGEGYTTINGGTFTNNDIGSRALTSHVVYVKSSANNKLTINGGIFQHLHAATSGGVVINNSSAVTADINGGSFSGGNYFGKWDNLTDYGSGATNTPFAVTGGTFTGFDNKFLAEGYYACAYNDGFIVLANDVKLAFDSSSLLVGSGENGKFIIADDMDINSAIGAKANANNTIDLNGKTLTATGNHLLATQGENSVLTITGNGKVVTGSGYAGFASTSGKLVINGGTYLLGETNNKGSFFGQNSSTIVINDGEFISNDANTPILYCINSFIEINGGFFQNTANPGAALLSMGNNIKYVNNQKITLSGGTFVNWNPMTSAFAQAWTNPDVPALIVLADGYQMISETQANGDVWYMVVPME